MADENTAISGSRDTTLRIWDIKTGICLRVLVGHLASVRCLEIKAYDYMLRFEKDFNVTETIGNAYEIVSLCCAPSATCRRGLLLT